MDRSRAFGYDIDMDVDMEDVDEGFYGYGREGDGYGSEDEDGEDYRGVVDGRAVSERGGMFGRMADTFGTQKTKGEKGLCPFCKLLHADPLPGWTEVPNAQYFFGLEDKEILKMDYDRYACSLYHSILDYYQITVLRRQGSRKVFVPTCHEFRSICTEDDIFYCRDTRAAFVHPDPLNPAVMARVGEWIETCNTNHKACQGNKLPQMPTRVLDVGDSETSPIITLVDSHTKRAQYIALSHCWGKTNSFTTTRDNLANMKRGFNMNKAPKTFRDAITITRKLGIRYLWIDSLCIIQKDLEDWQIESARMGTVYRDAYLTIAAEDAKADEEGFLNERAKATSSLEVLFDTGHVAKVYLRPQHYQNYKPNYQHDDDALRSRGWCLQEAYLSRRLLKFYNSRIIFACQEFTLDEGVHDKYSSRSGDDESLDHIFPSYDYSKPFPRYQKWYDLIEAYSKRNLSFESDRLPALSGLASLVAERKNGQYISGIWWEDAIYGLCWRANLRKPLKKSDAYLAPSWSWASVIGPVSFYDAKLSFIDLYPFPDVKLKDYGIQLRGANRFGQVDGGWIKLAAPLAPVSGLGREDVYSLGGGEDSLQYDFADKPEGDLSLLFLMWDERDSDAIERKDIMDLIGIVVSRVEYSQLEKYGRLVDHARCSAYKKVGLFMLERARGRGDFLFKRLSGWVKDVVLI